MTNINISNISKCEVFPQTAMLLRLGIGVRIGMSRQTSFLPFSPTVDINVVLLQSSSRHRITRVMFWSGN